MQKPAQRISRFCSTKRLAGAGLLTIGLMAGCGDDDNSSPDARKAVDAAATIDADTNEPDAAITDAGVDDAAITDAAALDAAIFNDASVPVGNGNAVWAGDFTTNGVEEFAFFDGTNISVLSIPGVTVIDDFQTFAISPDGTKIAVGLVHDGGTSKLLVSNLDGSGVATTIVDDGIATVNFSAVSWSPDGSQLALIRDLEINGAKRVYAAPADGSTAAILVSQNPADAAQDAQTVDWVDNTHIVYRADLVADGVDNFYSSDITLATIAPVSLIADNLVSNGAEVRDSALTAGGKIYFRSTHEGRNAFYRVDVDAANLEMVPAFAALTNGNGDAEIGAFALSPDGTSVAFSADSPTATLYQVFVAPVNGTAVLQSNVTTTAPAAGISGPVGADTITWSADGTMLAVRADWAVNAGDLDNDTAAFIVPAAGAAGGIRIWTVSAAGVNQDVVQLKFSSDSASLFARADIVTNNNTEILRTTDFATADQDGTITRLQGVPAGGDVFSLATVP